MPNNQAKTQLTDLEKRWLLILEENGPEDLAGALYDLIFFYMDYAPSYIEFSEYQQSLLRLLWMAQALHPTPSLRQFSNLKK